jgi:hypothetical protein
MGKGSEGGRRGRDRGGKEGNREGRERNIPVLQLLVVKSD